MRAEMEKKHFYSNGKFMVTGEYLVLKGALSLALPLLKGQSLTIHYSNQKPSLWWRTFIQDKYWFEANFSLPDLAIGNANDFSLAHNLRNILLEAGKMNKDFLQSERKMEVVSRIDFNINWGMGSSSSLLANIAQWADVDPFDLHFRVSSGSGYDVAAALSNQPVLYRYSGMDPEIIKVDFFPEFHNNIIFGWLGRKQNSSRAVSSFLESADSYHEEVKKISGITEELLKTRLLSDFIELLRHHDKIISTVLGIRLLQSERFPDFSGYVKPMGAWGGDFAMFVSPRPREYVLSYLKKRDINTWFSYYEIVKQNKTQSDV